MISPEGRAIRATFARQTETPDASPQVMREEWEAAVANTVLPPTITVTPLSIEGMPAEWVSSPHAQPRQVLFHLHGGGFNAGSCVTHRELAARLCLASGVRVLLL